MPPQQRHGLLDLFDQGFNLGTHMGSKVDRIRDARN
jgi:hypothetical protein